MLARSVGCCGSRVATLIVGQCLTCDDAEFAKRAPPGECRVIQALGDEGAQIMIPAVRQ
jgi:hypothetical protein